MKTIYQIIFLFLAVSIFSCTEGIEEDRPVVRDQEQLAQIYMNSQFLPLFFGKVLVNDSGNWTEGWIINEAGELVEVNFNALNESRYKTYPTQEAIDLVVASGNVVGQIESLIPMRENHVHLNSLSSFTALDSAVEGEAFFGMTRIQQGDNCQIAACLPEDTSVETEPIGPFVISIISNEESTLNHSKAESILDWLMNIDTQAR